MTHSLVNRHRRSGCPRRAFVACCLMALRSFLPNEQIARGLVSEVDLARFLEEKAQGFPCFLLLCWDLTPAPTMVHLAKLHLLKHLQKTLQLPVIVQLMDDLAFLLDKVCIRQSPPHLPDAVFAHRH